MYLSVARCRKKRQIEPITSLCSMICIECNPIKISVISHVIIHNYFTNPSITKFYKADMVFGTLNNPLNIDLTSNIFHVVAL